MSDVKPKKKVVFSFDKNEPQPLTEAQREIQREILSSISVLPSPFMSLDERLKLSQDLSELDRLRQENQRLVGEVESCRAEVKKCIEVSDFNIRERVKLRDSHKNDLKSLKDCLEVASRALDWIRQNTELRSLVEMKAQDTLCTINQLLEKREK